jgi:hypothetical protein
VQEVEDAVARQTKAYVDEQEKSFQGHEDGGCEPKVSHQLVLEGRRASTNTCEHLTEGQQGVVLM